MKKTGVRHRKAKGNVLENEVAKTLRDLYNLNDDEVERNPFSGNSKKELADTKILKSLRDTILPYVIECKFHEAWNMKSIFPTLNNTFQSWYKKVEEEAGGNYCPILVFSKAYYPRYLLIKENYLKKVDKNLEILNTRTYLKVENNYYIFIMKEFFEAIKEKNA